ncbi:MAG TPA: Gfo/Idh/MocA family oxidoreductase [Chloroflexia bacterium]|nr:Gfo/Idh/MocA family oxidoreductase [Chloroflexia bacterium]
MAERTVGFGVVGCGVIGPTHCLAIQDAERAELIGVCDTDPAKAAMLGDRFGVPYFTDLNELLAQPGLDAISVCVPSGNHAEVGVQAARAGKHVLSEKPIEITLEAADRLIAACEESGVKLGVISQHRFAPDVLKVKQAIEAGDFGTMVLGEASIKWYRTQQYYDSGDWRGTFALDGGGALMNQGVHYIDLLQWLMGSVESIQAVVSTRTHQIEVEDLGLAILRFQNGALGTITGSTSVFPGLPEKLEIHGSEATALIEADKLKQYLRRSEMAEVGNYGLGAKSQVETENSGGAADPAAIGHSLHTAQVTDFASAIMEDRQPAITGRDARRPLEIILTIYKSSAEKRPVLLNEVVKPG